MKNIEILAKPYSPKQESYSQLVRLRSSHRDEDVIRVGETVMDRNSSSPEPLRPHLIPIVGFDVKKEISSLNDQLNIVGIDKTIAGHRENIESWITEYVKCEAVIPINYQLNRKGWIVDKSDRRVLEQIDPGEREGAVVDVWAENEKFLADAPVGSVSMLWSPEGCSNLKDAQGREIEYPDSYFYLFKKEADGLKALTIRTNLSVVECQKLFYRLRNRYRPHQPILFLGANKKDVTNNLVKNGLYLEGDNNQSFTFEELIYEMVNLKENPFEGDNSSVSQVYAAVNGELKQEEQNLLLDKYIDDLSQFLGRYSDALQAIFGQKWVEKEMRDTLVKLLLHSKGEVFGSPSGHLTEYDQAKAVGFMQKFRGCFGVGGGAGVQPVMTIGGLRMGITRENERWERGECKDCGNMKMVLCGFCKPCGEKRASTI